MPVHSGAAEDAATDPLDIAFLFASAIPDARGTAQALGSTKSRIRARGAGQTGWME